MTLPSRIGGLLCYPVTNRHIEQTNSESVDGDAYNGRLCLLCPDNVEDLQDLRDGYVNSQGLNHWHTVTWDPGVTGCLGSYWYVMIAFV